MALIARTRRIDENIDLLTVSGAHGVLVERGRTGLAGRGEALRIPWSDGTPQARARAVTRALATIESDDEVGLPGCGPVAFGALPFDPAAPAELVVPQIVVGRSEEGVRWATTIGDGAAAPASNGGTATAWLAAAIDHPDAPPGSQPRRFEVLSAQAPEEWCALVEKARAELASASNLAKVVLARQVTITADQPLDRGAVLQRLRAGYPGCYLVSVDGLVAASPELLVSRQGDTVRSHPMAGTAPRGGDPTTDQRLAASLLASTKDRAEHQVTIDMVQDTLLGWCSYVDYEAEPAVVAVANVQHLATLIEGRLSQPAPSVLELVAALHPTPAVAGSPRDEAVRWIDAHERLDRRRYAGPAGWVDGRGNGTWAVAVRSAELETTTARVYAGNGIVADSDPVIELAETRAKLQAMLSAIITP
jgi:isochorismate synthase